MSLPYFLCLCFAEFALLLLLLLYVYCVRSKDDMWFLPCPPASCLLWGHELEAFKKPSGEFYTACIKKYGPTYRIKGAIRHHDILVLADPSGISHLSRNVYDYPHSAVFRPIIERLLGRALVWVEGESEHKRMRRLLNPAFTARSVKSMAPAIYDSAEKLRLGLENEIRPGGCSVVVNMLDFCSSATLDIIGKVGFSHDFKHGQSPEAQMITQSWRKQVSLGLEFSGFVALMILRLFPFITSLPIKPIQAQGETNAIVKECLSLGSKIIESRTKGLTEGTDLLSLLMRANSEDKDPISNRELLDHISTFVMVGHETTSISISFTLWELARNPEKQQRLRDEVLDFPGNPSYDDYQRRLPYLDACCKEGLRLHPPSAHMERVAKKRDVVPLHFPVTKPDGSKTNHIVVEKGQLIYVPSISVNRLDAIWGDGEIFRPERWLESNKGLAGVKIEGWSNIYTFSDGPRNCIGYRLAVFEWKILMLTLIRHFNFKDTGAQIISRFSSTLQPRVIGRESEGIQLPIAVALV